MPTYQFEAMDASGQEIRDQLDAPSEEEAQATIRQMGYFVTKISVKKGRTDAAAKAGMIGFSKSLAREVGSRGITVNCVAPGFIDTDMTRALDDAQRDQLLGGIPLGRLGAADEIASAVVFLASPGAGYITGETIHVNGGMHMA